MSGQKKTASSSKLTALKTINHSSPGVIIKNDQPLPMLTVYFTNGEVVNYVAAAEFAYTEPRSIGDEWQHIIDNLMSRYDLEKPEDRHQIGIEIIAMFKMTPDKE